MEQEGGQFETPRFSSPEEELKFLRERVAEKEQQLWQEQVPTTQEAVISGTITEYATQSAPEKLEEHLIIENPQFEVIVEHIGSLPHREKMRELYRILAEKGVLNAIKVAESQHNPHIEDDFHRVLVEYIRSGAIVPGLSREHELEHTLRKTLYEVTLPHAAGEEVPTVAKAIESMALFYSGMLPSDREHALRDHGFTLELGMSNFSTDIIFYVAVKDDFKEQFTQHLFGTFPSAKIEEVSGDYNIFNEFGVTLGSYATNLSNFVFPIADMTKAENDPMKILLSSLSRVERNGEGVALQLVVLPDTDHIANKVKFAIGRIKQNVPIKEALNIPLTLSGEAFKSLTGFFKSNLIKPDDKIDNRTLEFKDKALTMLEEKLTAPFLKVNARLVASAATRERAVQILTSAESAFNQYTRTQGNGIRFVRAQKGDLDRLLHNYTYRHRDNDNYLVLNTNELATIFHFPITVTRGEAPQLKASLASSAPAPADIPAEGTLLGINKFRGDSHEIRLTKADRLRHLYTIGQTGTGKSVFLKNLVVQDILAGNGACFIDPHGSDVQDVLASIPKERIQDVIYFDPSYMPRPFALNMLEYDLDHPEQKIFVVNEMLAIFKKLYASSPESMGPAFEQYFRNATMLVMEDPETGNTLLDIPRVLADVNFRNLKLSRCKNPLVIQFWRDIAGKSTGEASLANMVPYITNKFDVFIQNDIMRPIIAQEKSSFNFRDIMDSKKILLVNLAKGKLGEMNSNLIGLIIIGKFLMAAMSRVDSFGKQLPDFYLYVDEFQNIATPSISSILSEARKYGLSLNLAHQFIGQLPEDIKAAVFGNVGNMMVFRVGAEDAQFLESQFTPTFKAADIMKIENRNAYAKILINGKPVSPFNVEMLPPPKGNPEIIEQIRNLSYLRFGKDRKTVDDAIMRKYLPSSSQASTPQQPLTPLQSITPLSSSISAPQAPAPQSTQFAQAFAQVGGLPTVSTPVASPSIVVTPEPAPQTKASFVPPIAPPPPSTLVPPTPSFIPVVTPPQPVDTPSPVTAQQFPTPIPNVVEPTSQVVPQITTQPQPSFTQPPQSSTT